MKIGIGRRIITRGVIDWATLQIERDQEESFIHYGPVALADEASSDKLKAAVGAELAKHFGEVKSVIKQVQDDLDANKRVSEGTKEAVAKLNIDGQKLVADVTEKQRASDQRLLDLEQKLAAANDPANARNRGSKTKSLGQELIESDTFKEFIAGGATGSGSHKMRSAFRAKNITSLVGSGGPGAFPEYLPTPVIPAFQPLTIRDLLALGTTSTNLINWVQENVFTNNAGYQGSDGSLKPQSDITYVLKNVPVETLAHFIKASKQILSDFPQLQTLIDNRLTFGLKYAEEQQLLYGDGAAGHIHGLIPQATPYTGGYITNDTKIDTIRRAMLQVTLAYYPATGICMSPSDWCDIQLTKDSQNRYIWANPLAMAPGMLWGLPVAECFSMQRGDFLVGSMKLAVTLFDREESTILVSTEDQDNFVRNLVTILAEERIALAVSRPAAIIYGEFKSGETG